MKKLFLITIQLLIATNLVFSAEFETTINGNRVKMEYEDGIPFYPTFTMYCWDEEESLTIAYSELIFDKCEIENDKYKAEGGNLELEAYGLGNDFKMEITLKLKPVSNQLVFNLTGWENFNFYYQPPLTVQEILDGDIRPDNVIGSYAVYHKTKKHNRYTTGKAWHIYRPKFVDQDGNWAWADLDITNSVYTVTIPQYFLDLATYPMRANDTFGYTSIGGSGDSQNGNQMTAWRKDALGVSGSATKITAYSKHGSGSPNSQCSIYDDNAGTANNLIGTTNETAVDTTAGWDDFTFAAGVPLTAQQYHLAYWTDGGAGSGGYFTIYYDSGSAGDGWDYQYTTGTYNSWEDPFAQSERDRSRIYSIYATYTPTAGAVRKIRSQIILVQ